MKRTTIKLLILALASVLLLALTQSAYAEPTYSVTLIAYDKTNGINEAGGEVAFSDSGKGTTISGDYGENTSRIIGVYPASDYTFTGWAKGSPTGEIVSTASPYTFTVTEAVTFYALFEKALLYDISFMVMWFWLMMGYTSCYVAKYEHLIETQYLFHQKRIRRTML